MAACIWSVAATRAGGIPEIVRHGQTGLLAQNRNPESIAETIVSVMTDSASARDRAENALQMLKKEFTTERMVRETAGFFQELLSRPSHDFSRGNAKP